MSDDRMPPREGAVRGLRRGSILIASYFVIATLLGLAIPQTMRSLTGVRLEERALDQQRLRQTAEAGLDGAIRAIWAAPAFGRLQDGTSDCAVGPATWDCGALTDFSHQSKYSFQVRDEGRPVLGAGKWLVRKRIRVTAQSGSGTPAAYEAILRVARLYQTNLYGGVTAFEQVTVGVDSLIKGDVTSFGSGQEAVYVKGGGRIEGKVQVGPSTLVHDNAHLCCDDDDAIRIANNGSAGLYDPDNGALLADNANGNNNAGPPDPNDIESSGNPNLPYWRLDPKPAPIATPVSAACSGVTPDVTPDTVINADTKFCQTGTPDADCAAVRGVAATDGTVEYCFESLEVKQGSEAQFEGNKVRILVRGRMDGTPWALKSGPSGTLYSYQPGTIPTPAVPKELAVHVTEGNTNGVWIAAGSELKGSIYAPLSDVKLGVDTDTDPLLGGIDVPGYVVGRTVWVRAGGEVRVRKSSDSLGDVAWIRVLAWRKCQTLTCNP